MIIDRPTPATQNGLENVIRGWPKWMFCKAFKKHKLCSSWRVQKAYWVGIAKSFADFCTCFSLVITPHNMPVSILFVCTATHVPWRRVQKAYWVGIAKSFADFCTCFSLVITPHNMPVSILFVCTATHVPWRTGYKKLIEWGLPSHLLIIAPASPATQNGLENVILVWPSSLSALHTHVPDAGYKKLIEWGLPSHLLIFAPASAWSLLHITCLSPSSLSALLHMCRDALVGQKLRLLSFPQWTWLVSSSAHPFPVES